MKLLFGYFQKNCRCKSLSGYLRKLEIKYFLNLLIKFLIISTPLADNSAFRNNLIEYYHQQSDSQLQKIKSGVVDSKLILFSNIFIPNFFLFYLETNLSKSIKSKITQLRISAHCLNIVG